MKTVFKFNEIVNIDDFIKEVIDRNENKIVSLGMRYEHVIPEFKNSELVPNQFTIGDNGEIAIYYNGDFLGIDANSIGPHGRSDFWDQEEDDGNVITFSTTQEIDVSIFVDHCYNVVVINE